MQYYLKIPLKKEIYKHGWLDDHENFEGIYNLIGKQDEVKIIEMQEMG